MYYYSVLYAEDDLKTREIFSEILKGYFTEVCSVQNGLEAMKKFDNTSFDIVITDISMPKVGGLELSKHIKSRSPNTPILLISAHSDYGTLSKAIDIGVDGYVLKPIDADTFIAQISKIIKKLEDAKKSHHYATLLKEYKEAIDRSSIVSKTDTNGFITYVNESFCNISQYDPKELLGKPHNIIRHPDMPASSFRDMWRTIQSKKPWKGIVKNRKKDGGAYYVQTLVNPILNEDGEVEEYIAIRHDITELESYRVSLETKLRESMDEIVQTQKEIIYTMGAIGEKRSEETGLHVKRVAVYSYMLARLYGLDEEQSKLLEQASPMHDIGKVGIPDSILNKKGPLDKKEREIIETHATLGYEMLKHSNRELLKAAAIIAHEHHEYWNGKGYPRGLKGENIHIFGRITAIADVYDALGHDRVYKKAWPVQKIISLFEKECGEQFDPVLTTLFLQNIKNFEATKRNFESEE